jgi:hypothetical protein
MQNHFTKDTYLSGLRDPTVAEPPSTNDRSWLEFAGDTAIGLAKPVVSAIRTPVEAARMGLDALPKEEQEKYGSGAHGVVADVGRGLSSAEQWLEEHRSARDKALDEASPFPGQDQRNFWREPGAATFHNIVPLVPYVAGAVLTGGTSLAAKTGTAAAFGALGVGSSIGSLRSFADNTPLSELQKLQPFQDYYREFQGDEQAARNKLFNDSVDVKTEAANFGVNALTFGAFLNGLGSPAKKAIAARLKNMLIEGGSGAVLGGAQGAVSGYGQELAQDNRGQQAEINPANVA